jgi:hypothetical protein
MESLTPQYRLEHRTETGTVVVAYSSDVRARQAELSQYAAELVRQGATGVLVLVDQATGEDVARRTLVPDDEPGDDPPALP